MKKLWFAVLVVGMFVAGMYVGENSSSDQYATAPAVTAQNVVKPKPDKRFKNATIFGQDAKRVEVLSFKPKLDQFGYFTYAMKVRNTTDENLAESGMFGMEVNITVLRGDDVLTTSVSFIDDLAPGRTITDRASSLEQVESLDGVTYEVEIS